MKNVRKSLFIHDPYSDFVVDRDSFDADGWNGKHPVFSQIIDALKPQLIVEVGTWKGESAITIAKARKEINSDFELVCVDTWLGAPEFWQNKDDTRRFLSFKLSHGYPQVYFTFLNNIVCEGLSEFVTPFPATSFVAQRWFASQNIYADMIYIDAAHEYQEVASDIRGWWKQLRVGGIMIGDDFSLCWPGVIRAVEEARETIPGMKMIGIFGEKWVAQKQH